MTDPVFSSWENCEGGVCCTEATAIMDALIAERDRLKLKYDLAVEGMAARMAVQEAELARLKDAARWLLSNERGGRGEPQARRLLEKALEGEAAP